MQHINFFKEDVTIDLRTLRKFKNWINRVVEIHHKEIESVNYILCSDEYLHNINEEYLKHDTYTDIITFDLREHPDQEAIEADIFISVERVKDNAKVLKIPFENELSRVIIHGILHLLGYKDKTKEEKELMRREESMALKLL